MSFEERLHRLAQKSERSAAGLEAHDSAVELQNSAEAEILARALDCARPCFEAIASRVPCLPAAYGFMQGLRLDGFGQGDARVELWWACPENDALEQLRVFHPSTNSWAEASYTAADAMEIFDLEAAIRALEGAITRDLQSRGQATQELYERAERLRGILALMR